MKKGDFICTSVEWVDAINELADDMTPGELLSIDGVYELVSKWLEDETIDWIKGQREDKHHTT